MKTEIREKIAEIFEKTEDKNLAVQQAVELIVENKYGDLIAQLHEENEKLEIDREYRSAMGTRKLSAEEQKFYQAVATSSITITDQGDIIPTSIIDRTLADVKKASDVLELVNMAPADVKNWITGSHSGAAVWAGIFDTIDGLISGTVAGVKIDANKLTAYVLLPKAIKDLALPFVDVYFRAILAEAIQDGLEKGYIQGNGKTAPIGIINQINSVAVDGTHNAKSLVTITALSPAGLATARQTLSNGGKRAIKEYALICNPLDEAAYIDPAMMLLTPAGYIVATGVPMKKYVTVNCPQGKSIITAAGLYTMGLTDLGVKEYTETKALDDVDVLIAKAYGNGRADDDSAAVVFDPSNLTPIALPVTTDPF